jgi:hypothetical protein
MRLLPLVRPSLSSGPSACWLQPFRATVLAGAMGVGVLALIATPAGALTATGPSFVGPSTTVSEIGQTIPSNGDVNPYGVAVVQKSQGLEVAGDVLVSNFNSGPAPSGLQGRGTTIVQLNPHAAPNATPQVFAQVDPKHLPGACPGGVGLTTALSILPGGWVVVGSLPTSDGSTITGAGCLLVINSSGKVVETFSGGPINGPWDMTAVSFGGLSELFFTNVLNGTVSANGAVVDRGTVVRAVLISSPFGAPKMLGMSIIGAGFPEQLNSAALVIGPTGVALGKNGALYVADTLNNRITAIPFAVFRFGSAGVGIPVSVGGDLNGPLGLVSELNGNLLAANGGDGNLVEMGPFGNQLGEKTISPGGPGALFGLALSRDGSALYFVDDSENQLNVLQ